MDADFSFALPPVVCVERSFDETTAFEIDELEEEGAVVAGKRRRRKSQGRRVSFAEVTSLHIFPRDDEYETPPRGDAAVSPGAQRRSPRIAARMSDPDKENMVAHSLPPSSRSKRKSKRPLSDRAGQSATLKQEKPKDWLDPRENAPLEEQAEDNTGPVDLRHLSVEQNDFDMDEDNITLDSTTFALKLAAQQAPVQEMKRNADELNFVIHKRNGSSEDIDENLLDDSVMSFTRCFRRRKSSTEIHTSPFSIGNDMSLTMQVSAKEKSMVKQCVQGISVSAVSQGIGNSANTPEDTPPIYSGSHEHAVVADVAKTIFTEDLMDASQTTDMSVSGFSLVSPGHEDRSITMGIPSLQDLIAEENYGIQEENDAANENHSVKPQIDSMVTDTTNLSGQQNAVDLNSEADELSEKLPLHDSVLSSPAAFDVSDAVLVSNTETHEESGAYGTSSLDDDGGNGNSLPEACDDASREFVGGATVVEDITTGEIAHTEAIPRDLTIQARELEDAGPADGNTVQVFNGTGEMEDDLQENLMETEKIRRGRSSTQTEVVPAPDEDLSLGGMPPDVTIQARESEDAIPVSGTTEQICNRENELDNEVSPDQALETLHIGSDGSDQDMEVLQSIPTQDPNSRQASPLSVKVTKPEVDDHREEPHESHVDSYEDFKQYLGSTLATAHGEVDRPKTKLLFEDFLKLIGIQIPRDHHIVTYEERTEDIPTVEKAELETFRDAVQEADQSVGSLSDSMAEFMLRLTATSPAILQGFRDASESDRAKLIEQRQRLQNLLRIHANKTFHRLMMDTENSFRHKILKSIEILESCRGNRWHVWKYIEDECRQPKLDCQNKRDSMIAEKRRTADLAIAEKRRTADLAEQARIETARAHLDFLTQRSQTLKLNQAEQNSREQRANEIQDYKKRLEQLKSNAAKLRSQIADGICMGNANLARNEVAKSPYNYIKEWKDRICLLHEGQDGFEVRTEQTDSTDKVITLHYRSLLQRRYTVRKAANAVNVVSSSWIFDSEKIAEMFPRLKVLEGLRLALLQLPAEDHRSSQPSLRLWQQMYGPVASGENSCLSRYQLLRSTLEETDVRTSMQATRRHIGQVLNLMWEAANCEETVCDSCRGGVLALPRFRNDPDCKFYLDIEIIDIILSIKLMLSINMARLPLEIFPSQVLPTAKIVFCAPAARHLCKQEALDDILRGMTPGDRGLHRTVLAIGSFLLTIRDNVKTALT